MRSHRQHSGSHHDARRRGWPWCVLVAGVLVITTPVGSARADPQDPPDPSATSSDHAAIPLPAARSFAPAGTTSQVTTPYAVTLEPSTDTIYVAGRSDPSRLFVLDARGCTLAEAKCRGPLAAVGMGLRVLDIAVDPESGTVFVSNTSESPPSSVRMVDGRTCNARDVSGCADFHLSFTTDFDDVTGLQVDARTHTLYVAGGGFVSVFDTRTCNAGRQLGGCDVRARATTSIAFADPVLDETTDTLYVPQSNTVAIVDTRTCNATDTSGCSRPPVTFPASDGAAFGIVDHSTGTLYVSRRDSDDRNGRVSVVDARRCNARTNAGCPSAPPRTAVIGPGASHLAVDPRTHSLYGLASGSGVVSVVDTRHCRARHTSRCKRPPKTMQTGTQPLGMAYDSRTGSLYVANQGDSTVQVLDATRCTGVRSTGCRKTPPTAPATANSRVLAIVHTIYQAAAVSPLVSEIPEQNHTLSFIDTRRCNRKHRDCSARRSIDLGYFAHVYVDPGSSTVYLVDTAADVVHLVDARGCNVSRRSGCRPFADVGIPGVGGLTINPSTHTVYATQENATTLAVLPGAHCNALDHTHCDATAHEVELGGGVISVGVDVAHDTVYVSAGFSQLETLLPSAACDTGSAGCVPVTTTYVGGSPGLQLVMPERHSLYAAGRFGADTLTILDTATCNVHRFDGCGTSWPRTATPDISGLVHDRRADKLVVASGGDSTVTVIDPKVCSATTTSGCARTWPRIPVGFGPSTIGTDWRYNTLYVDNDASSTVSLLDLADPCRRNLCISPTG